MSRDEFIRDLPVEPSIPTEATDEAYRRYSTQQLSWLVASQKISAYNTAIIWHKVKDNAERITELKSITQSNGSSKKKSEPEGKYGGLNILRDGGIVVGVYYILKLVFEFVKKPGG